MITWSNEKALDNYIQRLQQVANKLTDKNRRLRNWHRVLGDKLCELMNLDLVRQRDRFKAGIKDIRGVFEKLEASEVRVLSRGTQATHKALVTTTTGSLREDHSSAHRPKTQGCETFLCRAHGAFQTQLALHLSALRRVRPPLHTTVLLLL